jgi:hypothetical protein
MEYKFQQGMTKSQSPAPKHLTKTEIEERQKQAKKQREKDREMVKGIFKFYEVPGGQLSFVFRKWKGDPIERYDLRDGEVYTIPLGVAKHLNSSGWYPVHAYTKNEKDAPSMRIGQKVHRYGFQSLEFVDVEEMQQAQSLTTVEYVE